MTQGVRGPRGAEWARSGRDRSSTRRRAHCSLRILSLNDLARHRSTGRKANGLSGDSIAQTLAAISTPGPVTSTSQAAVDANHAPT